MADARLLAACADVVQELAALPADGLSDHAATVHSARIRAAKRHGLSTNPRLTDVIRAVPPALRARLVPMLRAKPVRTASGVAVVAVMCKPHRCPHIAATGNICVYCPGGPDSDFEYSTQSYTGYEPTSMRAIRARYDPGVQARGRLAQLESLGHAVDKVEYIIMGGTFMALPAAYRASFIAALHDALSGAQSAGDVALSVAASAASARKCVGITIETRPDYCQRTHLDDMLAYGCTRLEIGVQAVYEDVARDTNRGHTVASVAATLRRARDAGFKSVVHMMPDLPNVGWDRDVAQFRELFASPAFRPDGLKLYPTLVIRGTGLYELWRTGRYRSCPPDRLVELLARVLAAVPPWTRVYRVQRDIPMPLVTSGVGSGNLRELVLARMRDRGWRCRDVRTREVGIAEIRERVRPAGIELVRRDYVAADGWETFLSYEDTRQDILVGLLRLRRLPRADPLCGQSVGRPKGADSVHDVMALGWETLPPETDPLRTLTTTNFLTDTLPSITTLNHGTDTLPNITIPNPGTDTLPSITTTNPKPNPLRSITTTDPKPNTIPSITTLNFENESVELPLETHSMPTILDLPPGDYVRPELLAAPSSIVRELHVYGSAVPVSSRDPARFQHQGFGVLLMEEAERIARDEHRSARLFVIAGVGTRNYYRRMGYVLVGPYMAKDLS